MMHGLYLKGVTLTSEDADSDTSSESSQDERRRCEACSEKVDYDDEQ